MGFYTDLGAAITVALQALVQIVLGGLLQRPWPKADYVAVIGERKQLGDPLRAAQWYFDVGLYDRTGEQCGQGEGQPGQFKHSCFLVSESPSARGESPLAHSSG